MTAQERAIISAARYWRTWAWRSPFSQESVYAGQALAAAVDAYLKVEGDCDTPVGRDVMRQQSEWHTP